MKLYFDNADYDDQLKRTASAAYCRAADLGEMLVAAAAVKIGDPGSWYTVGGGRAGRSARQGFCRISRECGRCLAADKRVLAAPAELAKRRRRPLRRAWAAGMDQRGFPLDRRYDQVAGVMPRRPHAQNESVGYVP